jgi:hypothetical protein
MDIDELREILKTELVTVVFTKKDGSKREMHCTMISEYLPVIELNPNIKYGPSPTIVTVWDLEQNAWRSFKFDSILSIETDNFNHVVECA